MLRLTESKADIWFSAASCRHSINSEKAQYLCHKSDQVTAALTGCSRDTVQNCAANCSHQQVASCTSSMATKRYKTDSTHVFLSACSSKSTFGSAYHCSSRPNTVQQALSAKLARGQHYQSSMFMQPHPLQSCMKSPTGGEPGRLRRVG